MTRPKQPTAGRHDASQHLGKKTNRHAHSSLSPVRGGVNPKGDNDSERNVLAHIVWVLGGVAVTWASATCVGITIFQPTSIGFLKDLTYSATIVHTLSILGVLLLALHGVLHVYRKHATDGERFPGQIGTLVIPQGMRWLRVMMFVVLVLGPTGAYSFLFFPRMLALSIVHRDGNDTDADTKKGISLLTDWGTTYRPGGRTIFHGWYWYSWNDERKSYAKSANPTGIDAWPGLLPSWCAILAVYLVCSLAWLAWRPLPASNCVQKHFS